MMAVRSIVQPCPTMSNLWSNLSLWLKARSIPGDLVHSYSRQCVFFWDSMGRSSDSEARIISGKHMLCGRQCLLQDLRYKHSYTWMSVLFAKIVCIHWYVHIMHLRYVYIYMFFETHLRCIYYIYMCIYIYIHAVYNSLSISICTNIKSPINTSQNTPSPMHRRSKGQEDHKTQSGCIGLKAGPKYRRVIYFSNHSGTKTSYRWV